MAGYAPSALRALLEAHLVTVLGAEDPPWVVSRVNYLSFPGQDPQQLEALCFAVGFPETDYEGRRAAGHVAKTKFGVKYLSRVRADNRVNDEERGYLRGETLLTTLRAFEGAPITATNMTREVLGDGTVFYGHLTGFLIHSHP